MNRLYCNYRNYAILSLKGVKVFSFDIFGRVEEWTDLTVALNEYQSMQKYSGKQGSILLLHYIPIPSHYKNLLKRCCGDKWRIHQLHCYASIGHVSLKSSSGGNRNLSSLHANKCCRQWHLPTCVTTPGLPACYSECYCNII